MDLVLGRRRPATTREALLVALGTALVLVALLSGLSALSGGVDLRRVLLFAVGVPLVRLVVDLVRLRSG